MSDWIKVSDREPTCSKLIIAYMPDFDSNGAMILVGRLQAHVAAGKFCFMDDRADWYDWRLVTRWMPCPEAPE